MAELERVALERGRRLLTLDTATGAAARLYERMGWSAAGTIPGYALNPDGTLTATTFYWKELSRRLEGEHRRAGSTRAPPPRGALHPPPRPQVAAQHDGRPVRPRVRLRRLDERLHQPQEHARLLRAALGPRKRIVADDERQQPVRRSASPRRRRSASRAAAGCRPSSRTPPSRRA